LEQGERTLATSLMLCAFFDKRLKSEESSVLINLLFGPFWEVVGGLDSVIANVSSRKQWQVEEVCLLNSSYDGTAKALSLLDFRVNRLCKMLSVCDCWPSDIGRHLALWLDSHMHLVLATERKQTGPQKTDEACCQDLKLCDWRYFESSHVVGVREAFCDSNVNSLSIQGSFYKKMTINMSLCRNLSKTVSSIFRTEDGQAMTCAALCRLLLGITSHKADFKLRRCVHMLISEGLHYFFNRVVLFAEKHSHPVVFIAFRELMNQIVKDDIALHNYLTLYVDRWNIYTSNLFVVAEMLRVNLMDKMHTTITDKSDTDLLFSSLFENESNLVSRNIKKQPGLVCRGGTFKQRVSLKNALKMIRIFREKSTKCVLDNFTDMDMATKALETKIGKTLDFQLVFDFLQKTGARAAFCQFLTGISAGPKKLNEVLTGVEFNHAAFDCIALIEHTNSLRTYLLPKSYAEKQKRAVFTRFGDTTCSESEKLIRASEILWCDGCKIVKNFVLSNHKKEINSHSSCGYKRVCHDDGVLLCDEKRKTRCCEHIPIRRARLLWQDKSYCFELFGKAYVITMCCGRIALLKDIICTAEIPLSCTKCYRTAQLLSQKSEESVVICHFCNEPVSRRKGSFTGKFVRKDSVVETVTFCKRHRRFFMTKENEPIDLESTMLEIPKRLNVK